MSSEAHDTNAEVDGTQADKINSGALGTLVVVGLLAMISITAAVTALVRHEMEGEESEKDADQNQTVIQLKSYQRSVLNAPAGYIDRGKGVITLPIDVAKSVVVSELQRDPNSATAPAPPPTASAAAAAPASANSAVTSTDAGTQTEPAGKPEAVKEKAAEPKPAPATSAKPAPTPATSVAPASLPKPTPTAATAGAESPGPLNH
ncbi:MAG: hypothetical protein ABI548_03035 [Polyangiaceae bacterium]